MVKGARTLPQINLRVPPELKQWLAAEAAANCRSLTGQITAMLLELREQNEKARDAKKTGR
ncbi:hypothetical protein IGB42_02644 [Andreprevotia sp. IGB-42]|uniref:Arc family DNA-binding protein n=1 Tax=Andreprevotia sp. IGB-42 TaxID=2497473 RepID=UPI001358C5AB|nr:Arc family DNA-binding protein [Andreprevotia sp. IGB-42]KAF0812801.1 hypothetical protein IGB42_02644 [Andreprevotia sp. IGB-42]